MFEKIRDFLAEQLNVDAQKITLETDIAKDLNADSIDVVELLFKLEEDYNITIDDNEAVKIKTVGDIVSFLAKNGIE